MCINCYGMSSTLLLWTFSTQYSFSGSLWAQSELLFGSSGAWGGCTKLREWWFFMQISISAMLFIWNKAFHFEMPWCPEPQCFLWTLCKIHESVFPHLKQSKSLFIKAAQWFIQQISVWQPVLYNILQLHRFLTQNS